MSPETNAAPKAPLPWPLKAANLANAILWAALTGAGLLCGFGAAIVSGYGATKVVADVVLVGIGLLFFMAPFLVVKRPVRIPAGKRWWGLWLSLLVQALLAAASLYLPAKVDALVADGAHLFAPRMMVSQAEWVNRNLDAGRPVDQAFETGNATLPLPWMTVVSPFGTLHQAIAADGTVEARLDTVPVAECARLAATLAAQTERPHVMAKTDGGTVHRPSRWETYAARVTVNGAAWDAARAGELCRPYDADLDAVRLVVRFAHRAAS